MITQQELTPATIEQSRFAQQLGVDTESNHMSGALAMFCTQKAILYKKLRKLQQKRVPQMGSTRVF